MPELRRRFCVPGTWKFADNGVRFTGASTVPVTRYRYRGSNHPDPVEPQPDQHPADPAAKAHGAPGAVRIARRVRRGGRGNPPGAIPAGRLGSYPTSPQRVTLAALVKVAGLRWTIEENFQAGKGLTGLDEHQVRRWNSWYRWVTLAMLGAAVLTIPPPSNPPPARPRPGRSL